jgi:type VI secretion system protein VasJ
MAETLEELEQIGKISLGENAPDPRQVRDEGAEFAQLEKEINKLGALSGDPVEWREVIANSSIILREQSKDLEVATYLCRGLWEREGYAGLRVSFTVLRDIIQEHWDIAFPKKPRVRSGKITWLVDRVGKLLPNHEPKPEEKDIVIASFDLIKEIEGLLRDKLGDNAPILRGLREPFETYRQNFLFLEQEEKKKAEAEQEQEEPKVEEAKKPEESKPTEVVTSPPPVATPSPKLNVPPPQSVASATDIKKAFKSCHTTLYQIAKVKRAEKLSDPLPYRILRFATWVNVEKQPFLLNGKFVMPGPPKGTIGEFASLLEQGQHAALIEKVENFFANPDIPANVYWLDAHRFTAMALEGLGAEYQPAKQTVIEELAAFLQRVPGLEELVFNDSTPFADAQTKLWIQEQVLVAQQTVSSDEPATRSSDAQQGEGIKPWMKTAKEAKKLASKGQFTEGLGVLQEGGKQAKGQREQFFWLLEQARFCYDTNHIELAIPQLDFLEEQVKRFALEEWEPTLGVEVALLLLKCHKKLPPIDKESEINKRLYKRLCRLDVSAALSLSKQ